MFFFESFQSGNRCFATTITAWTLSAGLSAVCWASEPTPECQFKGTVFAGEPSFQQRADGGGSACFDLTLDEPGWLLLFVEDLSGTVPRPQRLDVDGPFEVTAKALHQTSNSLLFAGDPATYQIRISPEDPEQTQGPYVLRSSFVRASQAQSAWTDDALAMWLKDQRESAPCGQTAMAEPGNEADDDRGIEVVIDPFADPCLAKNDSQAEDDRGIEVVIDPFTDSCDLPSGLRMGELAKGEDNDDRGIEVVIDPFAAPCDSGSGIEALRDQTRGQVMTALCSSLTLDDHGDTFACASGISFGRPSPGTLWSGEANGDFFTFRVDERSTIIAEVQGSEQEPNLAIFDQHGQRLGRSAGQAGSRWAGTLVPGQYFVEVRAHGSADDSADSSYVLELQRR